MILLSIENFKLSCLCVLMLFQTREMTLVTAFIELVTCLLIYDSDSDLFTLVGQLRIWVCVVWSPASSLCLQFLLVTNISLWQTLLPPILVATTTISLVRPPFYPTARSLEDMETGLFENSSGFVGGLLIGFQTPCHSHRLV